MIKDYSEVVAMPRIKENFETPGAGVPEVMAPPATIDFSKPPQSYIPYDTANFLNALIGKTIRIELLCKIDSINFATPSEEKES